MMHELYTAWCAHGVLFEKVPMDSLNKLSVNSFPELLEFSDKTLTKSERFPPTDPSWRSPLLGTALGCQQISLN